MNGLGIFKVSVLHIEEDDEDHLQSALKGGRMVLFVSERPLGECLPIWNTVQRTDQRDSRKRNAVCVGTCGAGITKQNLRKGTIFLVVTNSQDPA